MQDETNNIIPIRSIRSIVGGFAGNRKQVTQQFAEIKERMPKVENIPIIVDSTPPETCTVCNNARFTRDPTLSGNRLVPCPRCGGAARKVRAQSRVDRLISELVYSFVFPNVFNIPDNADTRNMTLANYPALGDKKAKMMVEAFIKGRIRELILSGAPGRGKSGLAISAVKTLSEQGAQVLFLRMKQYMDLLMENFNNPDNHIKEIARLVDVLVIDDLGTERVTDTGFSVEETQSLIEDRHAADLQTLITTNMTLEGLVGYWHMKSYERSGFQPGSRIVSRLDGWYTKITLDCSDLRKKRG